jgi:hypothetical protein
MGRVDSAERGKKTRSEPKADLHTVIARYKQHLRGAERPEQADVSVGQVSKV